MQRTAGAIVAAICVIAALSGQAKAETIGVQFQGWGAALDPADSTGVVAQANWNVNGGDPGSIANLVDETGTATTASLDLTTSGTFGTFIPDSNTPIEKLFSGYADTLDGSVSTFTFSNLASAQYNVIIYGMGDTAGRNQSFTVNGSASVFLTTMDTSVDPTAFIRATGTSLGAPESLGNYVEFDNVLSAGGIAIVATPQDFRAAINGIQLVAVVPEPTSLVLCAAALGGLALRRRSAAHA